MPADSVLDDAERRADLLERVECELELVTRMRGRDDRADARLAARDGRKRDALSEHAFSEEAIRQLHRERVLADDHRRNRTFTGAGIEPQGPQAGFEESRIVPELRH